MMRTKHRRLFGQNNRNARHFYSLSANRNKNLSLRVKKVFVLLTCLFTPLVFAQAMSVEQTVNQYVKTELRSAFPTALDDDLQFTVNYPNTLLNDKQCNEPIAFDWRGQIGAGANTLNISCQEPLWQAYLPIQTQVYQWVVVAAEPLSRNKTLMPTQLQRQRLDIGSLRSGYFTDTENLAGYEIQRTVQAGQVITPYIVKAPFLVKRGDWVTVISGKGALTVTVTGEALKDGQRGEQIPIRNLKTEQKFKAWILSKGVVTTKKELL